MNFQQSACETEALQLSIALKEVIWRDIEGYEGLYQVSNTGLVRSLDREVEVNAPNGIVNRSLKGKELKPFFSQGYLKVALCLNNSRHNHLIHRLVAKAFHENPLDLPQVNHIDAVKTNNSSENLEWVTESENTKHAFKLGILTQIGSNNRNSRLSEKDVLKIKRLLKKGLTRAEIGRKFNYPRQHISSISTGKLWRHVKLREKKVKKVLTHHQLCLELTFGDVTVANTVTSTVTFQSPVQTVL